MLKKCLMVMALAIAVSSCKKDPETGLQNEEKLAMDAELKASLPGDQLLILQRNRPMVCIDQFTNLEPIVLDEEDSDANARGVYVRGTKWANGKTLRVFFINGSAYLKDKVITYARRWENHTSLRFVVTNEIENSDIRVGFKLNGNDDSWSKLGIDAKNFRGKQTMNFGWFDRNTSDQELIRTTVHEFGHAIGLGHEHLSPVEKVDWNKPVVYAFYMGPPNNWTRAQVNFNIFEKYKPREVRHTRYDPKSIMHYPVNADFTTDGVAVGWNWHLSDKDKIFIKRIYPD